MTFWTALAALAALMSALVGLLAWRDARSGSSLDALPPVAQPPSSRANDAPATPDPTRGGEFSNDEEILATRVDNIDNIEACHEVSDDLVVESSVATLVCDVSNDGPMQTITAVSFPLSDTEHSQFLASHEGGGAVDDFMDDEARNTDISFGQECDSDDNFDFDGLWQNDRGHVVGRLVCYRDGDDRYHLVWSFLNDAFCEQEGRSFAILAESSNAAALREWWSQTPV